MTAQPPHGRKLGLLGTSLTKCRLSKESGPALDIARDEIEPMLIGSRYLDGAPFSWVTIAIRYGLKEDDVPHYERINKRYGDLPLAIEIDIRKCLGASLEDLTNKFKIATLKALIHAGEKYDRPIDLLKEELNRLADGVV